MKEAASKNAGLVVLGNPLTDPTLIVVLAKSLSDVSLLFTTWPTIAAPGTLWSLMEPAGGWPDAPAIATPPPPVSPQPQAPPSPSPQPPPRPRPTGPQPTGPQPTGPQPPAPSTMSIWIPVAVVAAVGVGVAYWRYA